MAKYVFVVNENGGEMEYTIYDTLEEAQKAFDKVARNCLGDFPSGKELVERWDKGERIFDADNGVLQMNYGSFIYEKGGYLSPFDTLSGTQTAFELIEVA